MARPTLVPKPLSPIVPIALKLKELGYDPVWLHDGKDSPPKGWPELPNEPEDIRKWHGRSVALRMHGHQDLFAVDLDIQRQDLLDAVVEHCLERWPAFVRECVVRHSGGVKTMLIGRLETERKHMTSGRWGVCEEFKGGHRAELFTSNDRRYIGVWGKHSEGKEYGYDGPAIWEVVPGALPLFRDEDLNALLGIVDEVMEGAGLTLAEAGGEVKGFEATVYDLTADMVADCKDGRQMTLEELEEAADGEFIYVHGRLFDPGSESYRIKAKVTSLGLTLWDFGGQGDVVHYWKHLGPQPEVLQPLLRELVARVSGDGGGAAALAPDDAMTPPGVITQDSVALAFAERLADDLQYCHHTGMWYYWTGVYWMPEKTRLAFHCCRELGRELSRNSGRTELKEVRKISFAGGVEKFAQADRRIATTSERWDNDPWLLGTPEGTLDLRTGVLREARQADGITKLAACAPRTGALTPRWIRFLRETFGGDEDLIGFTQRWFGYCLTGDVSEHALWFGFGEGGNGKGVLINTIAGILKDYAVTAAMDTFVASKSDRHLTELAMLRGARLVTASETEKGRAWAESRLKQLTGGDPITARFMRQDHFTYLPQFKLSLIGNHKPVLRGVDDAVRRRFNLAPFLFKPAPEVIDRQLEQKLRAEWPGILAWMVEGCLAWQRDGLQRPESVKVATESYFEDQDLTGQWVAEYCDVRPTVTEPTAVLYTSWRHFAEMAGEHVGTRKAFGTELARRGFELCKTGDTGVRSVRGIKLKATPVAKAMVAIVPKDNKDLEGE